MYRDRVARIINQVRSGAVLYIGLTAESFTAINNLFKFGRLGLKLIKRFSRLYFTEIFGFCLMGNHSHILVKVLPDSDFNDDDIAKISILSFNVNLLHWFAPDPTPENLDLI
jgi:hypothetical protein